MEEKKKLVVSFSGGETSAFMAQWIWNNWQDQYEMVFVFSNTGQENEETLVFVDRFQKHFNIPVTWVEARVVHGKRKGTMFNVVDFESASRNGEPFEDVISKYGIPNQAFPHCTRELKLNPINNYVKSLGWKNYFTAVGIRADEFDRVSATHKEKRIVYPLISDVIMTKQKVNEFWNSMPFRLSLKGYQGNCITCWKKSDSKLFQIAKENRSAFDFMARMESKYGSFIGGRKNKPESNITFFRGNRSVKDILDQSNGFDKDVVDDSIFIESESCDIYSNCGD